MKAHVYKATNDSEYMQGERGIRNCDEQHPKKSNEDAQTDATENKIRTASMD
jgi:hypothetical protein